MQELKGNDAVRAVISDGDSHLVAMINQSINNIYINTTLSPC
jgi:hypothetical protein